MVASIFLDHVVRPIRTDNGKPRNISLLEVLFKFASDIVQDVILRARAQLHRGAGPRGVTLEPTRGAGCRDGAGALGAPSPHTRL